MTRDTLPVVVLGPGPGTGAWTSTVIGTDGLALIVYGPPPGISGPVKVAHCSNRLCFPYYRPR